MGQYDEPGNDAAFFHPRYDEPVDLSGIQSNLLVPDARRLGRLYLLRSSDTAAFRRWLGSLPVTTAADRHLVEARPALLCTVALTARGLAVLAPDAHRRLVAHSPGFGEGMSARAEAHGAAAESPRFRDGASGEVDALLSLAAEAPEALDAAAAALVGAHADAFAVVHRVDIDRTATGEAHEHFGFADPVSQPGVFGWFRHGGIKASLTRRANPVNRWEGHPGQPLLPLGHFVHGYLTLPDTPAPELDGAPWLRGGSFVVATQLEQRVGAFHAWLHREAALRGVSPALVGSRVVGRWATGTPTVRAPFVDDHDPATETCTWNNFSFFEHAPRVPRVFPRRDECVDDPPPDAVDPAGARCPFSSHVRKSNPRDTIGDAPGAGVAVDPELSRRRLMLRRAVPYGPASASRPEAPYEDGAERGIVFVAVVASIERQFEEVSRILFDPDAPHPGAGPDALLGPPGRSVSLGALAPDGRPRRARARERWVVPRGGVYLYAPPPELLRRIAAGLPS